MTNSIVNQTLLLNWKMLPSFHNVISDTCYDTFMPKVIMIASSFVQGNIDRHIVYETEGSGGAEVDIEGEIKRKETEAAVRRDSKLY